MLKGSEPLLVWQAAAYRYEPWSCGFGSIKFGGLMKKNIFYFMWYRMVFQMKVWVPDCPASDIKDCLRTFFLCFLFFFSRKTICCDQDQSPFQVSWHTYVKTNHFRSCFYYCNYMMKRRTQSKMQNLQIFKCKCPCKWTIYPHGENRSRLRPIVSILALILGMRKLTVRPTSNYLCVQKIVTIKFISALSNFIFRFLHSLS